MNAVTTTTAQARQLTLLYNDTLIALRTAESTARDLKECQEDLVQATEVASITSAPESHFWSDAGLVGGGVAGGLVLGLALGLALSLRR